MKVSTKKGYILGAVIMGVLLASSVLIAKESNKENKKEAKSLYAVFKTNQGSFKIKLFRDEAPITVDNFVGLAKGTKEFVDPKTAKKVKRPFYNGLIFHRIIANFMIQGGDPLGSGRGGPGYQFEDEFDPSLRFDKPGLLAMANAGPGTNGSQFFITVVPTPHLNNRHTIFGEVVENYDVVDKISKVMTGPGDRPVDPVVIEELIIEEK
jgi:peptidyl-prolyl cis-trans isomerase A (cyclophilin A)